LFGEDKAPKTERFSFFRRLAHKRGSPYIAHEDVIILRKPETTEESCSNQPSKN